MRCWDIQPLKSVGKIKFGNCLADVCRIYGDEFKAFYRSPMSYNPECDFESHNFCIHLTQDEYVQGIWVYHPEQAYFQGIQLLNRDMYELQNELHAEGYEFQFVDDMDGLIHIELGIGITMYEGVSRSVEVFNTRMHWYEKI